MTSLALAPPIADTVVKITVVQWLLDFYPQGKTSITSPLNIPGRIGWATMEAPGFILLLYIMYTLPKQIGLFELPGANWLMASLFVGPSFQNRVEAYLTKPWHRRFIIYIVQ